MRLRRGQAAQEIGSLEYGDGIARNHIPGNRFRRAVSSVPSNVAEGAGRQTKKEFINYLHMAQGSLSELDTHLELARRLGYLAQDSWTMLDRKVERIDKMLSGLIRHQKAFVSPNASRLTPYVSQEDQ